MKALIALALTTFTLVSVASAQTQPSPSDSSAPSAASSPHQRDATSNHAAEAPATNGTAPASASSPHQQQVTGGAKSTGKTSAEQKKMMKDCMTAAKAKNNGMSKEDMKATCTSQVKGNSPQ
jgi:hypothetical protein